MSRHLLAHLARQWAVKLTERPSVTGSADEASFGPWLAAELALETAFGTAEIWSFPVAAGDARHCVAMLVRGRGTRTVILTGHYDTVTIEDYGPLRDLAIRPDSLAEALREYLSRRADHTAVLARADLESGAFLPGRGLLDMKAGLAAGLAACAEFAGTPDRDGNLLFLAVPDEENNSAGARAAAPMLPAIAGRHGLAFVATVNLDAIADDRDGRSGRIIALGTVGKVLPTAFVAGVPTHSGFPLNGINAATIAAAIATRVEWAPEMADGDAGTPPSLLSLQDGKAGYDVTTPASAFATFNVLHRRRTPAETMDRFDALCAEAAASCLDALRKRAAGRPDGRALPDTIPVHRYEAVRSAAVALDPAHRDTLAAEGEALAAATLSLPEKCRRMTALAWSLSGLAGPAVVTGFGSIPYLATHLSDSPEAARLRRAAERVAAEARQRYGVDVACEDYFAGISDMSFFGEAQEGDLAVVAANTPLWHDAVRWPAGNGIANIPTVNLGPWGRDYHTPLERLETAYAFEILPGLLADLAGLLLQDNIDGASA